MSDPEQSAWQEQRRAAATDLAAAAEARRRADAAQAAELLRGFAAEATRQGIPTTELTARGDDGRARYRTGLRGWYLRRNRTLGVGEDGSFYILSVPGGLRARLTGVTVPPSDPPLVVGAGGRDGESIPLPDLLHLRLDAGDDWE
ncbi:hypothetical protein CLV35_2101 [Motilibacter peucedani]|uniref:Uncharacterized protein n=1 Tax=Motilibacter peucedani TaxID=598650 RepID=A0A420XQW8_9ACTN|nr:hypothetical protein [Motilibacter peucedani]RKS75624.1 hypothetical protein CLV35_2101 [Motilibacter peucedani]